MPDAKATEAKLAFIPNILVCLLAVDIVAILVQLHPTFMAIASVYFKIVKPYP